MPSPLRSPLALIGALLLSTSLFASEKRLAEAAFAASVTPEKGNQVLQLRNSHLLEYLFVDVYSAALYAPADIELAQLMSSDASLRLELYYYRSISREDVIKAAWTALQRQYDELTLARLKPGIDQLHANLSDISDGDRYSLTRHQGKLVLRHNEKITFESEDPQLANAYLGIWLSPNGLSEELRTALLE
ncbi:MAG: chalcone isomerase family protein [Halopseudomonas sp.]|uniref:chalcone isomerase family protein n=1 Tax=Halopseudomonas sp. TaxID=2901191 RepID=UPI0030037ABF